MAKLHAGLAIHGTSILAVEQTAGKGQRGKEWVSNPGENITMSLVISIPHSFSGDGITKIQSYPFLFSAAVALGCYDFTKAFEVSDISIKWPNDLYFGDRKAGGILIENVFHKVAWTWSVIGIGINLNQTAFHQLQKATSVGAKTGKRHDVVKEGRRLREMILSRLKWLQDAAPRQVMSDYNDLLYRSGEEVRLKRQNATFTTTLLHVDISGKLHTSDVLNRTFDVGDVEFV